MGNCTNRLDRYTDLITSFRNLQGMMGQGVLSMYVTEYVNVSIRGFLQKLITMDTVQEVEESCYWFERYRSSKPWDAKNRFSRRLVCIINL